jgi:hypothetical protein
MPDFRQQAGRVLAALHQFSLARRVHFPSRSRADHDIDWAEVITLKDV